MSDAVVEDQVIVVRQRHPSALDERRRGEVLGMDMKHALGPRIGEMDAGVDVEGYLAQLALTTQHLTVEIAGDEVARGDLLKEQTARVDQEEVVGARQHQAMVIADLLVPAEPRADAEDRRKVAAQSPLRIFGFADFAQCGHEDGSRSISFDDEAATLNGRRQGPRRALRAATARAARSRG